MIYCFTKNLPCHHDDYFEVIESIRPAKNIKFFWPKILILFSRKKVIFFDIDTRDLKFFPLMMLRSLWGAKSIAISVSTEYLINSRTLFEFITKNGRNLYLRSVRNRVLFYLIKHLTKTDIYSIHKNSVNQEYFSKYIKDFFYDPQLWDAEIFINKIEKPKELNQLKIPIEKNILFLGTFDERRSRTEFLEFINKNQKYNFILACVASEEDEKLLKKYDNIFLINRVTTNSELFYLYQHCNVVYCFYTNQRPSGFFGRAMQLNKFIIVRSNYFLSNYFSGYPNLISLNKLNELDIDIENQPVQTTYAENFNDIKKFKEIITTL